MGELCAGSCEFHLSSGEDKEAARPGASFLLYLQQGDILPGECFLRALVTWEGAGCLSCMLTI